MLGRASTPAAGSDAPILVRLLLEGDVSEAARIAAELTG